MAAYSGLLVTNMQIDKRHYLLLLALSLSAFVGYRLVPPSPGTLIKTLITFNDGLVTSVDMPRKKRGTFEFTVDTLNFPEQNTFTHAVLGPFGFGDNFFADFEAQFAVKKPGAYQFTIRSDDGFRLTIDDELVCEFVKDRPMQDTTGLIDLSPGKHRLHLTFFQGYANTGLIGKYRLADADQDYFIGESSPEISFIALNSQQ